MSILTSPSALTVNLNGHDIDLPMEQHELMKLASSVLEWREAEEDEPVQYCGFDGRFHRDSITDLNALAAVMEQNDYDEDVVQTYMENVMPGRESAITLANLVYDYANIPYFTFFLGSSDDSPEERYGMEYFERYYEDNAEVHDFMDRYGEYFDFGRYGEDVGGSSVFFVDSYGYIDTDGDGSPYVDYDAMELLLECGYYDEDLDDEEE